MYFIGRCDDHTGNMKKSVFLSLVLVLLSAISVAQPVVNIPSMPAAFIQMKGVSNFYRVSNELFRSAQPTAEGMHNLNGLGIKTVVNLCSGADESEIGGIGLVYEHIPMNVWHPKEKQVVKLLQILTSRERTPVLVHCQHGADRTGIMCAVYRIAVQGWTKEEALKEMREGGFGFHQIWGYLITHWIKELNIEKIMQEAGIKEPTTQVAGSSINIQNFMNARQGGTFMIAPKDRLDFCP